MAEVFLSYARADAAAAERIARRLQKAGRSVWFDRELPAHRPYSEVIANELDSSAAVLVLWSVAAVQSEWVRSEANRARECRKLVQARLDGSALPMPFDQIQCANVAGDNARAGWSQVAKSIAALITSDPGAVVSSSRPTPVNRRSILIGTGTTAVAVVGGVWLFGRQHEEEQPNPEAEALLQKGIDALQNNDVFGADNPGSLRDAIALLSDATKEQPRSAKAWSCLALAYAALKRVSPPAARAGLELRSRSASAKALALNPQESRATGAILLLNPLYRNWVNVERADRRALATFKKPVPLLLFIMSDMLRSVGRDREAAAVLVKFDRKLFIIPGADEQVLLDLWSAGDIEGADDELNSRSSIGHNTRKSGERVSPILCTVGARQKRLPCSAMKWNAPQPSRRSFRMS